MSPRCPSPLTLSLTELINQNLPSFVKFDTNLNRITIESNRASHAGTYTMIVKATYTNSYPSPDKTEATRSFTLQMIPPAYQANKIGPPYFEIVPKE